MSDFLRFAAFLLILAYMARTVIDVLWGVTGKRMPTTPPVLPAPVQAPSGPESLDDLFDNLRRAAGPSFVDPIREAHYTPTTPLTAEEAKLVYAEHVRAENRLRKARIRRERWAAFKARAHEFLTLVVDSIKSFITVGD